ncbi:MAG: UDP-N-acetylmuramoyl-L-alanyl-D-glutamate--2,6-diaminopimelate ligase [Actinobacteria bacterium]|uniref:Unannotated protein n=1 Tax=freshwater metagenome TaxID=449393 RepID=A0A6J7L5Q5_9ZZZZ|nr:UDP-N-acetylmuramoyl-L-alanyl-D-glutamate--2,6-diaminopimelate ligase [Actinomycetota bacterium]
MSATVRPRTAERELSEAFTRVSVEAIGDVRVAVSGITHDSREVRPGDIYAALPGFTTHGADFVGQALAAGAAAIVTDGAGATRMGPASIPVLVAADPRQAAGLLAAWVYGDPADDLLTIGITGTNGKTTTSYLVDAGLRAAGHLTGVVGTIGTRLGDEVLASARTTPEATDLHATLAVMRERGITAVTMEVSSHALVLRRVEGIVFDVAGFTNLSRDHLDFHGSMEAYFEAKAELFTPLHARRGVVTIDDEWGQRLSDRAQVSTSSLATTGGLADWEVMSASRVGDGRSVIELRQPDGSLALIESMLPGQFNVANLTLAHALLRTAGVSADDSVTGLAAAGGIPGRMERVSGASDPVAVFVDYAHSPDAIDRVIATAREFTEGRVIVVVGAGGDRDREKRSHMGLAASAADVLVVTDDNPRSESAAAIRAEVLAGVPESASPTCRVIERGDRRDAIALALDDAAAGDCVLILGKGHETGQEVAGVIAHFDDREVAASLLSGRPAKGAAQ